MKTPDISLSSFGLHEFRSLPRNPCETAAKRRETRCGFQGVSQGFVGVSRHRRGWRSLPDAQRVERSAQSVSSVSRQRLAWEACRRGRDGHAQLHKPSIRRKPPEKRFSPVESAIGSAIPACVQRRLTVIWPPLVKGRGPLGYALSGPALALSQRLGGQFPNRFSPVANRVPKTQ